MRKKEYLSQPLPSHVPPCAGKSTEPIGGDVMLFDANEMQEIKVIPAHQAPLSCIAMNNEGTLLATASEKGTVIRVFALPSAQKLYQFRRGSMPSRIHCMSFNATSTLLCVSSATDTVHIFRLTPQAADPLDGQTEVGSEAPSSPTVSGRDRSASPAFSSDAGDSTQLGLAASEAPRPRNPGLMSLVRRTSQNVSLGLVSRAAGYLPTAVTEIWEPSRDFAWVKIPRSKSGQPLKSVVAMASGSPQVMVATNEGDFLVYMVDLEKGGEGQLVRQYSLVAPT